MEMTMEVYIDCVGTDEQVTEVFKATLTELVQKFPGALQKGPHWERLPGREKDMVIVDIPIEGSMLNVIRPIFGPTWRRIAYEKGRLPEYAIEAMRKKGELPAKVQT